MTEKKILTMEDIQVSDILYYDPDFQEEMLLLLC